MAEVLLQFDPPLRDVDGRTWIVRVCGRPAEDSLWEGWIEFEPQGGGTTLRTAAETRQPNRADLEYWATGLTVPYLEGALDRARYPETPDVGPPIIHASPSYGGPASPPTEQPRPAAAEHLQANTVLDPFEVYAQGEDILRQELSALDEGHLQNIIRGYGLGQEGESAPGVADRANLAEWIVTAVRKRSS